MRKIPVLEAPFAATPVVRLSGDYTDSCRDNSLYIKRDDLLPFSFGGNKARKAQYFYREIQKEQPDVIMTYGTGSSNHCRIIANMARSMGISCHIISPSDAGGDSDHYNSILVQQFGASIEKVPVSEVHDTIERRMEAFRQEGRKLYFIMGGGHGNPGTAAYVQAGREIMDWEQAEGFQFDYIFHASGTGTTQAGLVCSQMIRDASVLQGGGNAAHPYIVGISIARENPRGGQVVEESIRSFLCAEGHKRLTPFIPSYLDFDDHYRQGGYGLCDAFTKQIIESVMERDGIPMDTTYVGKAFAGMLRYLKDHDIHGSRILFIHTGGAPLYFDSLRTQK